MKCHTNIKPHLNNPHGNSFTTSSSISQYNGRMIFGIKRAEEITITRRMCSIGLDSFINTSKNSDGAGMGARQNVHQILQPHVVFHDHFIQLVVAFSEGGTGQIGPSRGAADRA